MVFPLWNVVVGPKISLKAHPFKLENGILKVIVSSSTWTQQLEFMKEQIIREYMELTGEELVKDIKFYTGRKIPCHDFSNEAKGDQLDLDFKKDSWPDTFQINRITLPKETVNLINSQVEHIHDDKLKKQIYSLIETDLKAKIWKKQMGWKNCPSCHGLMAPDDEICMICEIKKGSK